MKKILYDKIESASDEEIRLLTLVALRMIK